MMVHASDRMPLESGPRYILGYPPRYRRAILNRITAATPAAIGAAAELPKWVTPRTTCAAVLLVRSVATQVLSVKSFDTTGAMLATQAASAVFTIVARSVALSAPVYDRNTRLAQ